MGGGRNIAPERKSLYEQRDTAITQLTGNKNTGSYDTRLAAVSQQQGITYNRAVENENRTAAAFNSSERATHVVELPWETPAVRERVDELMANDGLSFDAAVAIAMTGRTANGSTAPEIDADWRPQFAEMVASSGDEIEQWATSQTTDAVTFVAGDNDISVTMENDMIVVRSSLNGVPQGEPQIIDPNSTERIVINAGDGNDTITIDPSVTQDLVVVGGDGDDFIYGGGGDDILIGGEGDDLVRGNDGADIVIGGNGDDNMEGGAGGDLMFGNAGADMQIGASGADVYTGADASDVIITDSPEFTSAAEVRVVEHDATAGTGSVTTAEGSRAEFVTRVEDDLETLRSLETGQQMLNSLDRAAADSTLVVDLPVFGNTALNDGNRVVVEELDGRDEIEHVRDPSVDPLTGLPRNPTTENGFARFEGNEPDRLLGADGTPGFGGDTTVRYNPSVNLDLNTSGATPPVVILFHELAHAYHNSTGTAIGGVYSPLPGSGDVNAGVNNLELQVSGIAIDHDNDPATPDQVFEIHPFELTENGLREELNLESRTEY